MVLPFTQKIFRWPIPEISWLFLTFDWDTPMKFFNPKILFTPSDSTFGTLSTKISFYFTIHSEHWCKVHVSANIEHSYDNKLSKCKTLSNLFKINVFINNFLIFFKNSFRNELQSPLFSLFWYPTLHMWNFHFSSFWL